MYVISGATGRVGSQAALELALVPPSAWSGTLRAAGFAAHIAGSLAQLYEASDRGDLNPRGDRVVHLETDIDTTLHSVLAG